MKLFCPKCNKPWNDLEIGNQVCNDCGTQGNFSDFDEKLEDLYKRMAEDPEFAREIVEKEKKIIKKKRGAFLVYIVIGLISYIIGYNCTNNFSSTWFFGGIFMAIIVHYVFNKYSKKISRYDEN
jgi:uncharacterized membrane protein YvbJ